MRIIDKQHDFYDYLQDPTDKIVFDRRGSFLLTRQEFCDGIRFARYYGDSEHRFVLLQCGATHWLFLATITIKDRNWYPVDYELEFLTEWKNYDRPNRLIKLHMISFGMSMLEYMIGSIDPKWVRTRIGDLVAAVNRGDYKVEKDLGCHFKSIDHKGTHIKEKQEFPILKACGIAELVNPVSVFCAIEEYFSIEKTASESTEPQGITDEDKVIMHGFDTKTSFRKMR